MISNSETTSFEPTKEIATIGTFGRGNEGMVLATKSKNGKDGRRWFSWEEIERLGLMHLPVADIVVPVRTVELGV